MSTLLVRHALVLVTEDAERREIGDGGVFARDGWIEQVGPTAQLPATADEVLDLSGHVVVPGLVNTHHHLFQTLTRALPRAQDVPLFGWLRALYPVWARLTPDDIRVSTQLGLVELALSGCTTAADHLYLFPNGCRLDDEIEAAREVGVRLHASRGAMSLGASAGGLPPDDLVEHEDAVLSDTERVIAAFHDPDPGAFTRIVVAPCSPFSVTPQLLRAAADLARAHGVRLHTHLAETRDENAFCLEHFGRRPLEHVAELGWLGADVWFAHGVHLEASEVTRLAATRTGVAHCPSSNMRLASGVAPLSGYLAAGVPIGLGVDGSASNDGGSLLAEARQAMLVARLAAAAESDAGRPAAPLLAARTALELATRGGAAILGRDDLGVLEPGRVADFCAIDVERIPYAGALHDPVAALVLCSPGSVDLTYVQGRPVVVDGRPVTVDPRKLVDQHNRAARRLVDAT